MYHIIYTYYCILCYLVKIENKLYLQKIHSNGKPLKHISALLLVKKGKSFEK